QLGVVERRGGGDRIECRRAAHDDAPRLLTELKQPAGVLLGRCEVQVAELCQCVANRLVEGPLARLAAVDVREWESKRQRGERRREHLEAVAEQEEDVGCRTR